MSKFKKGLVKDIKKENEYVAHQEELHEKYDIKDNSVIVVEKSHLIKFLIKNLKAFLQLVASLIVFVLATIGILVLIYPSTRYAFLLEMSKIYSQLQDYISFLPNLF